MRGKQQKHAFAVCKYVLCVALSRVRHMRRPTKKEARAQVANVCRALSDFRAAMRRNKTINAIAVCKHVACVAYLGAAA